MIIADFAGFVNGGFLGAGCQGEIRMILDFGLGGEGRAAKLVNE